VAVSSRHMFITEMDANRVHVLRLGGEFKVVACHAIHTPSGVTVCLNESVAAVGLCSAGIGVLDIRAASPTDWRMSSGTSGGVHAVDLVESEGRLYAVDAESNRSVTGQAM
jgi:hypothetical protein